jgi:hypothetical protein
MADRYSSDLSDLLSAVLTHAAGLVRTPAGHFRDLRFGHSLIILAGCEP